jgi:hypothetical protein
VFHAASHFPFLVVATLGQNFIGITGCMRIQLLPIFAVQAIQSALTSIAIDRLLSAVTPILYVFIYLFFFNFICIWAVCVLRMRATCGGNDEGRIDV